MLNWKSKLNNWIRYLLGGYAAIFILIIITPIILISNLTPYFYNRFEHYQVYQEFREGYNQVQQNFNQLINYINLRTSKLDSSFFSDEDIWHMQDVRKLYELAYFLVFNALLFLFLFAKQIPIYKIANQVSKFTILIISLLSLISIWDFNFLFIKFHQLSFNNDYWMLDPSTSNLIKYFPVAIFKEICVILLVIWFCLAIFNMIVIKSKNLIIHEK